MSRQVIGTAIHVRLPDELLVLLDERAATEGVKRAEMLRRLVAASLSNETEKSSA